MNHWKLKLRVKETLTTWHVWVMDGWFTDQKRLVIGMWKSCFWPSFMGFSCRIRNRIIFILLWRTVHALSRGLFWCLYPSLLHSSPYITLYILAFLNPQLWSLSISISKCKFVAKRIYRQISNTRRTKSQVFFVSSCSCLCRIHWSHVFRHEWRCSWSSADRRCANYIWVINNFIA